MDKEIEDAVWEEAQRRDEINLQAGDVLDVKASIILVVITLFAAVSTAILAAEHLPRGIRLLQEFAIIGMSAAVVFAVLALWPRDFDIPPMPEKWAAYAEAQADELRGHHGAAAMILERFRAARLRVALKRIARNGAIVRAKAKLNDWAFYATAGAICAELITLGWLARLRL